MTEKAYKLLKESIRRALIDELVLTEKLNKSDKAEIQKIAKKQSKKYFDAEIDKALGVDWMFGYKGKVNKFVSDEIDMRFKDADKDKAFADAVEIVTKRCLQAYFDMMGKKRSLIKTMSVPKS
jgi:hypothetical protein